MTDYLNYQMLRIRLIEERIAKEYPNGKMRCPVHLSIGQEAAAVGVCAAIAHGDKMVSTHRGHAHYLAKGGSLKGLIGELYGKSSGCSRGHGGSMHLIDLGVNFYGSTSIVGGTIPVGVGIAFADQIKKKVSTTIICIGDAAVEEGVFHEAANFASLKQLNVIFICENNYYSCYTHLYDRQPRRGFDDLAKAHKLSYFKTRPNDVTHIVSTVSKARKTTPAFVEIPTYRHLQHCGHENDDHLGYRKPEELIEWQALDPVKVIHPSWAERIEKEIDDAFRSAEMAPFAPIPSDDYVYKEKDVLTVD